MNSPNPYQASSVEVVLPRADLNDRKLAGRGARLVAVILDGLIVGVPLALLIGVALYLDEKNRPAGSGGVGPLSIAAFIVAGVGMLAYLAITLMWLSRYGQTVGKRLLKIRIERVDGTRASLGRLILLRAGITGLLGAIPVFGALISLIDSLMIFGEARRCLHDRIADTVVVEARD